MAGCCEYGDESSGSGATELVTVFYILLLFMLSPSLIRLLDKP
jgi:hypothetical protein